MLSASHIAPYRPLGWQLAFLRDKAFICLATGSAGGGKSRAAGEKIHAYLLKYTGATGLVIRKAREYVTKSAVPMLQHSVIGNDPRVTHLKSGYYFQYQNGSQLFYGGMKNDEQREALRSIGQNGALDIVWLEEANAFKRQDFNEIIGRMRGTSASWRQIMLTTNPDAPSHWIHQDLMLGQQATIHYSSASDNPYNSADYVDNLKLMTGLLKQRLVDGKWVQAEGVIYDSFGLERHVTTEAEYNPNLPIIWGVDDGYAYGQGPGTASYHPRVILICQQSPTGGLNVVDEYVKAGEVAESSLDAAQALGYPTAYVAYVDSSAAELKSRIWQLGIQTVNATHTVIEGIRIVQRFLHVQTDGTTQLKIHPRCTETIREMQSYRYDNQDRNDKPMKLDDHCMDALRYVAYGLRFQ